MAKPLRFLSPIHKAGRQISVWFERELTGIGLTTQQEGHILSYLRSYAPCPVGEVVIVFGLRGSTATSVLDRLEERGFIARRPNPDDRRSYLVELTDEGKRTAEHVQKYVDKIEAAIAKRVSPKDEDAFRRVMDAVAEATDVTLVLRRQKR